MNSLPALLVVISLAVQLSGFSACKARASDYDPLGIYEQVKNLRFDYKRVAEVNNVALNKQQATFKLETGQIYFSEPVAGIVSAMVFLGQGSFGLTPPNRIEKQQVRRFTDQDSIDKQFSALYVRFNDNTFDSLSSHLKFDERRVPSDVSQLHERITQMFLEDRNVNLHAAFTNVLLNESISPFFFAVMECREAPNRLPYYLIFTKDDNASEDIVVYQFSPHAYDKSFYTLCAYNSEPEVKIPRPDTSAVVAAVYPSHYKMDIEIDGEKMITRSDITITSLIDRVSAIQFVLQKEMEVDSVRDARGDTLHYIQEENEAGFTILLDPPLTQGETILSVYYHGKALIQSHYNYVLKNNIYWYPRRGYFIQATYDITYRYDKKKQLLSVGKLISDDREDKFQEARWTERNAVPAFAFGLANFDSTTLHNGMGQEISIHSVGNRSKSTRKRIGGDIASSFYLFQNLLGVYPYDHLHVLETPSSTSNGFAGLLFLAARSYEYEITGIDEALRSHEVSHQWWGNIVGWRTYHDQWLSEGLAEYFGALSTQFLLKDNTTFLEIIDGWRNDLLRGGHVGVSIGLQRFGFSTDDLSRSDGLKAGPIWLGNRLGQKYPIDYHLIVYEKGALVVHMLRLMMRDFITGSDQSFFDMLRDFVALYQNRKAGTEDFAALVAEHTGRPMGRFFEQWIYGTEVPTLRFDYKIKRDSSEKYWVDVAVEQEDVTKPFELQIPVGFMFRNAEDVRLFEIDEAQASRRFGPFDFEPSNVNFNTFGGVLARIKRM